MNKTPITFEKLEGYIIVYQYKDDGRLYHKWALTPSDIQELLKIIQPEEKSSDAATYNKGYTDGWNGCLEDNGWVDKLEQTVSPTPKEESVKVSTSAITVEMVEERFYKLRDESTFFRSAELREQAFKELFLEQQYELWKESQNVSESKKGESGE